MSQMLLHPPRVENDFHQLLAPGLQMHTQAVPTGQPLASKKPS